MVKKANGISEEARKAILMDVSAKIENGRETILSSLHSHTKTINSSLNEILQRIEDLKTLPVSA